MKLNCIFHPKRKPHVLRIIRELIEFTPKSNKRIYHRRFSSYQQLKRKKAIVFMISDFIADDDYEKNLKIASKKHDITGVRVYDVREEKMIDIGLVAMQDAETGQTQWVNTGSAKVRLEFEKYYNNKAAYFKEVFSKCGAGTVNTRVDESM